LIIGFVLEAAPSGSAAGDLPATRDDWTAVDLARNPAQSRRDCPRLSNGEALGASSSLPSGCHREHVPPLQIVQESPTFGKANTTAARP
jgi:hypothetical protein